MNKRLTPTENNYAVPKISHHIISTPTRFDLKRKLADLQWSLTLPKASEMTGNEYESSEQNSWPFASSTKLQISCFAQKTKPELIFPSSKKEEYHSPVILMILDTMIPFSKINSTISPLIRKSLYIQWKKGDKHYNAICK
jgi:hypothetical protein